VTPRKDFGQMIFRKKILPWVPYLFKIMSDGIGEARRRQLRCRKWISIVVQRCSYIHATEAVLLRIHYARTVISRSCAALRRYRRTLFKKDMEPRGDFFLKNNPAKNPPLGHIGKPLSWGSQSVGTLESLDSLGTLQLRVTQLDLPDRTAASAPNGTYRKGMKDHPQYMCSPRQVYLLQG